MKVSEAKSKTCPFITYASGFTCICGDCMAWEYIPTEPIKCMGLLMPTGETPTEHYCMSCLQKHRKQTDSSVCEKIIPTPEDEKEGYCKRLAQ